jgi:hypothetical protein
MDLTLYKNYQRITVQEAPGKVTTPVFLFPAKLWTNFVHDFFEELVEFLFSVKGLYFSVFSRFHILFFQVILLFSYEKCPFWRR